MPRGWSHQPTDTRRWAKRHGRPAPSVPGCEMAIRRGKTSDALCIAALGTQVFLDTYATDGIRRSLAREAIETLSPEVIAGLLGQHGMTFFVAETQGHLIGFAQLAAHAGHELVPCAAPAELQRLYVQEGFTGRGVGKALLRRSESAASADGADAMWLTAWSGNVRALRFYASQGYSELASMPFAIDDEQYENRLFAKALHAAL